MRAHGWDIGLPWGLGEQTDRGNEGACVGNEAIPETVLSRPLATKEQDGQKE